MFCIRDGRINSRKEKRPDAEDVALLELKTILLVRVVLAAGFRLFSSGDQSGHVYGRFGTGLPPTITPSKVSPYRGDGLSQPKFESCELIVPDVGALYWGHIVQAPATFEWRPCTRPRLHKGPVT